MIWLQILLWTLGPALGLSDQPVAVGQWLTIRVERRQAQVVYVDTDCLYAVVSEPGKMPQPAPTPELIPACKH